MNFDQASYVRLMQTIFNAVQSNADQTNPGANTTIEYFNSPFDQITFGTQTLYWVNGSSISSNPSETVTLAVTSTPTVTDPTTAVWGDANTDAHWVWGAGAVWG